MGEVKKAKAARPAAPVTTQTPAPVPEQVPPADLEAARPGSPGAAARTTVLQQQLGNTRLNRADIIPVELITELDTHRGARVGDAHGHNILMKIEESGAGEVSYFWFNFANGVPVRGTPGEWATVGLGDPFIADLPEFVALGRQLTASQWRALWPNPVPALLKRYEKGELAIGDPVVRSAYRGMVSAEARRRLDENEAAIAAVLDRPNRVARLEEYAAGLREASLVRDTLETHKAQVDRSLSLAQQQFHLGLPKRQLMAGLGGPERLRALQEQAEVDESLRFWKASFGLLTRLRTAEISAGRIEATLRDIRQSIRITRVALVGERGRRPTLDPWELLNVRAGLATELGPRTKAVVEAEDESRTRQARIAAVAGLVVGIALLFLPGGIFIDAAIGLAMGVQAWEEAKRVGHAARTAENVDEGLMTQGQVAGARFGRILATIFAVMGAFGATLRILRVGRAFALARSALPELEVLAQMRLARLFAGEPRTLIRLGRLVTREARTMSALREALAEFGDDAFRLRQAVKAIADGYTGPIRKAWMHGLHPDALKALERATAAELEQVADLMRRNPQEAVEILRQFTYRAGKAARKGEAVAAGDVAGRLAERLENLAAARARGYPFGFSDIGAFRRFGRAVRDAVRRYGVAAKDIRVQGSAVTSRRPGDIDVAILVDRAEFDALARQFAQDAIGRGNTKLARTIAKEAAKGKIPYNRFGPREPEFVFGKAVQDVAGGKVNVSLIPRGGEFDLGPYFPL